MEAKKCGVQICALIIDLRKKKTNKAKVIKKLANHEGRFFTQ